jgi:uncharacterized protein (DUF1800 family)
MRWFHFLPALFGMLALPLTLTLALAAGPARPDTIALPDRIGWGGGAPVADPQTWLQSQLHPPADDGLPPAIQARIDAMPISHMRLSEISQDVIAARQALRQDRGTRRQDAAQPDKTMADTTMAEAKPGDDAKPGQDPARRAYRQKLVEYGREAVERSLLRDIYSKNQLKEQLTWFWFNHFNVSQRKNAIAALVGDYEETAIRPHVLGKFRDLLTATAFHPAMMMYLDNQQNAVGHINENFAREIMELHTMGVGSGYSQKDVQELARILTGFGLNLQAEARPRALNLLMRAGNDSIAFNPRRHDFGDKEFLGHAIKGTGADEATQALLILSRQPATAHRVSLQLAQYFCCDAPSDALVNAMAASFLKSDGDIPTVLATLFGSAEFKASLGAKFKDPVHYAVSAVRAAYGDTPIVNTTPLIAWLARMGEPLYGHETPDGYAITQDAWSGPGAMETRFEIARVIGAGQPSLMRSPNGPARLRNAAFVQRAGRPDRPGQAGVPPDLGNSAYAHALLPTLAPATRAALAEAKTPADWNLLFLSSPEFMRR